MEHSDTQWRLRGSLINFFADLVVEFPKITAQLSGHGGDHFVSMQTSGGQAAESVVEPVLSPPGDGPDFAALAGLPGGKLWRDHRRMAVVGGALNEHPAGVAIAGFGDPGLSPALSGGVFCGNHAQIAHQFTRVIEA